MSTVEGPNPPPDPPEQGIVRLGRLLVATVAGGLLIGLLGLPWLGSFGMAAKKAADTLDTPPTGIDMSAPPQRSMIYAGNGQTIATFYIQDRQPVSYDQIAPIMRTAIVAIEDSRFYHHGALDLRGTMRALLEDEQTGGYVQGGSTLTQQYVKNLLIDNARTERAAQAAAAPNLGRKLRELRAAVSVEHHMTKNQILTAYLNIANFGSGAYGIQAAAQHYFGIGASDLTLSQAALLAGVVNSPTDDDPQLHTNAALSRRDVVLARMAQLGDITQQQASQARNTPMVLNIKTSPTDCGGSPYPFFCEYVKSEVENDRAFGPTVAARDHLLYEGGLKIHTTLDVQAQNAAQAALVDGPATSRHKVTAEAMVQPDTGDIQAIAQSAPWSQTQIDYAADYVHGGNGGYSIGSSAKIFTLAAALNAGLPAGTAFKSPAMMTVGGYTDCRGRSIAPWTVRNAEPSDNGKYTMKTGTWQSINTYYAQLERKVGICAAVRMAKKFGMVQATGQPVGQYPSFTLGAGNYDVVHEAAAYAGFAANGRYCAPVAITGVTDAAGRHLRVPSAHCSQVLDPNVAEAVTSILRGVLTKGTAKGQGLPGRQAAGKTGTCETFSCALFAGYTPNLAAAVWYGDPDAPYGDPSYGVYGANTAPIWRYSMLGALAGQPAESFREPADDYSINVRVPDVSGMSLASAEKALTTAGFGFRVSPRRSATSLEPVGTVDHTTPSAGDDIDTNTAVVLYMSG